MKRILCLLVLCSFFFLMSCSVSQTVSTQVVENLVGSALEMTAPTIDNSLATGGSQSYAAWTVVDQSLTQTLIPALTSGTISASSVQNWLTALNANGTITDVEASLINVAVNTLLSFIPTSDINNVLQGNPTTVEIQQILVYSFTAFSKIVETEMAKYTPVIPANPASIKHDIQRKVTIQYTRK